MEIEDLKGDWGLITGASSGIGHEFAFQLAAAGMNLVIVARRKHLLEKIAKELTHQFGTKVWPLMVDLTHGDSIKKIRAFLDIKNVKIRMLVNSAAFGHCGSFESISNCNYTDMINLNTIAIVSLCQNFLVDLSSHPTSVIINVSSQAAYNPIPYMSVYAATKAFVSSFSQAIYWELKDRGILVQTLVPGPTETNFDHIAGITSTKLKGREKPEVLVKKSLSHLKKNEPVVIVAKGVIAQRIFAIIAPVKFMLNTVANMFKPSF